MTTDLIFTYYPPDNDIPEESFEITAARIVNHRGIVWLANNTDNLDGWIKTRAEFERLAAKAVADGLSIERHVAPDDTETNVVELNPEMRREMMLSIEWHRHMETACRWLWKMHKAGQLPDEVAEAFNHLFQENGYDISEMVGCESLMEPGSMPLD